MHAPDGWSQIGTPPALEMLSSHIQVLKQNNRKADRMIILNAFEIYRSHEVRTGTKWPSTKQMAQDFNVSERYIRRLKSEFIKDRSARVPPQFRPGQGSKHTFR